MFVETSSRATTNKSTGILDRIFIGTSLLANSINTHLVNSLRNLSDLGASAVTAC
jgi:hypothetical protein